MVKYWTLPLVIYLVMAVINYFVMALGWVEDIYSTAFLIFFLVNLFVVVGVGVFSKIPEEQKKFCMALWFVITLISILLGSNKFSERFINESYTVEAVLHKYTKKEYFGKSSHTYYMFNVNFRDKSGNVVVRERAADLIYGKYQDGDTVIVKISDKFPEYFEVISKK